MPARVGVGVVEGCGCLAMAQNKSTASDPHLSARNQAWNGEGLLLIAGDSFKELSCLGPSEDVEFPNLILGVPPCKTHKLQGSKPESWT